DTVGATVGEAVARAELVVLAVPVLALRELLASLAPYAAPSAVVTDVGSTKAQVVAWAEELLPAPQRLVGRPPNAGRRAVGGGGGGPQPLSWLCLVFNAHRAHGGGPATPRAGPRHGARRASPHPRAMPARRRRCLDQPSASGSCGGAHAHCSSRSCLD